MKRVVVVHGQEAPGAHCRSVLERAGYETIVCRGPQPLASECYVLEDGSCPLCESVDLLVYDPLGHESLGPDGVAPILATLRRRYSRKPVVVLGASADMPLGIAKLAADDPDLHCVPWADESELCRVVQRLVAAERWTEQVPSGRWAASRHDLDPGLYGAADCGYCD
jgi:hypothetical protein